MCTCGDKQQQQQQQQQDQGAAAQPGRVFGGGHMAPHKRPPLSSKSGGGGGGGKSVEEIDPLSTAASAPLKVEDYIAYIQKSVPGASTAVVRGLVNRHLQNNPTMSMATMLGRVRRQLH
jgi:hypothetical protein